MKTIRALIGCRKGTSAVELALIATPLVLLLFGVSESARFYWTLASLQSAAEQTSRCMAIPQPACATAGAYSAASARSHLEALASSNGVAVADSQITLSNAASCGGATGFSEVTINYTFTTVVPLEFPSMSRGVPIKQTACFPNL